MQHMIDTATSQDHAVIAQRYMDMSMRAVRKMLLHTALAAVLQDRERSEPSFSDVLAEQVNAVDDGAVVSVGGLCDVEYRTKSGELRFYDDATVDATTDTHVILAYEDGTGPQVRSLLRTGILAVYAPGEHGWVKAVIA